VPAIRPRGGQRFDYWGALTLLLSLLALLLGLTLGQRIGFGSAQVLGLIAAWAAFLIAFLLIESRSRQPMIDLQLFQNRLFSINLVTGFITFIAIAGTIILMPFYLENVLGYAPQQVGLMLAVVPVALGLTAPLSGALSDRFGTRPITVSGLAMLAIGYFAVSSLSVGTSGLGYVLRFLPIGLGMGIFQSPNNSAIMGTAPRDRMGIVSGMLALNRTLGQTTGIAVLGAIWASRTFTLAGQSFSGGATSAPAVAQVSALHDVFLGVVVLVLAGLGLAIWAVAHERRGRLASKLRNEPAQ